MDLASCDLTRQSEESEEFQSNHVEIPLSCEIFPQIFRNCRYLANFLKLYQQTKDPSHKSHYNPSLRNPETSRCPTCEW